MSGKGLKKGEAYHKSTWRNCAVCETEFLASTATVCRSCQLRKQQKAKDEEYERLVENGGVAEL